MQFHIPKYCTYSIHNCSNDCVIQCKENCHQSEYITSISTRQFLADHQLPRFKEIIMENYNLSMTTQQIKSNLLALTLTYDSLVVLVSGYVLWLIKEIFRTARLCTACAARIKYVRHTKTKSYFKIVVFRSKAY